MIFKGFFTLSHTFPQHSSVPKGCSGYDQEFFGPGPSLWKGWWQLGVINVEKGRVQPLILDPTIPQLSWAWSREALARGAEGNSPKQGDCFSLVVAQGCHPDWHRGKNSMKKGKISRCPLPFHPKHHHSTWGE